ncbi:uncharacterized protein LOC135937127 [Cloeon dipterum]|uniref:uncharacterized protein LOC135937127 n=1 Tax=Cloeon dipterum TaxID=197152 RepID=UPI00321FFBE8
MFIRAALLLLCLLLANAICAPADFGAGALAASAPTIGSTSGGSNNNAVVDGPSLLGRKPGGLRLITEDERDVRIIFLFDFKPVHLFPKRFSRRNNAAIRRNIITKYDVE